MDPRVTYALKYNFLSDSRKIIMSSFMMGINILNFLNSELLYTQTRELR